jgi:hypothetical protein
MRRTSSDEACSCCSTSNSLTVNWCSAFLPAGLIVVASATKMGQVLERVNTTLLIGLGLLALLAG